MSLDLWQRGCERLAAELPEQQFNTWIRPLAASVSETPVAEGSPQTLQVRVPNRFKLDWIRAQYAGRLEAVLAELAGVPVRLELSVVPTRVETPAMPLRRGQHMQQNFRASHCARSSVHELEFDHFAERRVGQARGIGDIPLIQRLNRLPEVCQVRCLIGVARDIAVVSALQMRAEDVVDHVDMVQRVNDVAEPRRPWTQRFPSGQRQNCRKGYAIRPCLVPKEKAHEVAISGRAI